MHHLVEIVRAFAESSGGLGLAVAAFVDSSLVPLPLFCDIQIVYLVIQHPARWPYYGLMTTAGSLAGSYVIYALGRKGGEAFLRRRFQERHIERGMAAFRRYGLLAVIVPSILPPPMPFKIFILLAGVGGVSPATFVLALTLGRGVRYGGEALLAVVYGEVVTQFIHDHLAAVSIWLAVALVVLAAGVAVWRRVRAA
jgi:membrane protein YqaA with SNARE-associated domain